MGWTFFYMFVVLKIPVVAACLIVWWAVKNENPDPAEDPGEGGHGRDHPRPRHPPPPRRGPHADPLPAPPKRVRTPARMARRVH
ncbi:MAG TPA: hypothetical protein VNT32_08255 [Thermoleophilaceae bacterium]|nr:hypothetical protein [Thermoleophilaceae bacterium]